MIWKPREPHIAGQTKEIKTSVVISEIPSVDVIYDAVTLPKSSFKNPELDIDIKRRHAQIQVALYKIGLQLGFRTWVAINDKAIQYDNKKLGESEGIIGSLNDEKMVMAHPDVIKAALYIDCIWFKNGKLMPAVMEIEHSTGVVTGLARMKNLQDLFPSMKTRYVIVASEEDRKKVLQEANKSQFKSLKTQFFPYSAVEELYSLCERRKIKGVTEEFLDCFMEQMVE